MRRPRTCTVIMITALALAAGSCSAGDRTTTQADRRVPERGVPKKVGGPRAFHRLRFSNCRSMKGGFDIEVSGLSCGYVARAQLPWLLGNPFGGYNKTQEKVYRPKDPRLANWTCWARFHLEGGDVQRGKIRHGYGVIRQVCWRGGNVLLFTVG